jgi:hypothetical protein
MPLSARSGPMDTTGLDGAITTQAVDESSDSPSGAAVSAPTNATLATGTSCRRRTKYSWNETVSPFAYRWPSEAVDVAASVTRVSTGWLLIGTTRYGTFHARAISPVTCSSEAPSRSRAVRYRCVARSRSPRLNQSFGARESSGRTEAYRASDCIAVHVSSRNPQPRSGSMAAASV